MGEPRHRQVPERWGIRDAVIRQELIPILARVAKQKMASVIDLYKALQGHNGVLVVAGAQDFVKDVLVSVNLDKLLMLAPNRDQGVALARKRMRERRR